MHKHSTDIGLPCRSDLIIKFTLSEWTRPARCDAVICSLTASGQQLAWLGTAAVAAAQHTHRTSFRTGAALTSFWKGPRGKSRQLPLASRCWPATVCDMHRKQPTSAATDHKTLFPDLLTFILEEQSVLQTRI